MSKQYEISRTIGQCRSCDKPLEPGQEFFATVTEGDEGEGDEKGERQEQKTLLREDFCIDCWQGGGKDGESALLALWRTRVPREKKKKKTFVDDDLLKDFFRRLGGADEEEVKVSFRFVLALVLMRKKLLVYDRAEAGPDGREIWSMHFKGSDERHCVTDPHMDEDKIADVSRQLGAILEGEL